MSDSPGPDFEWAMPEQVNIGQVTVSAVPVNNDGSARRLDEVVVDPAMIIGSTDDFPKFVLMTVMHPRHGELTFLIPRQRAGFLGAAIQQA